MSKNPTIFSCLVIIVATLAITQTSHAQNSPQDFVDAHNAARAEVGVADIEWDDDVAAYAQQYANQLAVDCVLIHSNGPYGENLAGGPQSDSFSGTDAVKLFVDEKANYDYDSNSCVGGECLHYTQVVWRKSVRLGCARVPCNGGGAMVVCNYDPQGNFIGERPY